MSNRRLILQNLLFLAVGGIIGVAATAWVLSPGPDSENAETNAAGSAEELDSDSATTPGQRAVMFEQGEVFSRDIAGDCDISGRVLDAEGRPQSGAQVFLRLLDEPWPRSHVPETWTSGSDGGFTAPGLACDIPMQVWAVDSLGRRASSDGFSGEEPVDLRLEDGGALRIELDGSLEDGDDIHVLLAGDVMWPPRSLSIPTPEDHSLLLHSLPPGAYAVVVSSLRGAFVSGEPIPVEAGGQSRLKTPLAPASPPRVRLVDAESGAPIPDAPVLLRGPIEVLQMVTRTDADGKATFPPLPTTSPILIEGLASGVLSEVERGTPAREITAEVPPRSIIEGVVRTASGRSLSGVEITAEIPHGNRSVEVTSVSGQYFRAQMLGAAASGWPALIPARDGFAPGPARIPIPVAEGETMSSLESVRGLTDDDGSFELSVRRSGRLALRARHPEHVMMRPAEIELFDGADPDPATITMYPGLTAQVTVSDSNERPLPGAEVSAYGPNDALLATGRTDDEGAISLKGLPPNVRIEAAAPGTVPAFSQLFGKLGRTVRTGIVLAPAEETLEGRVLDADGAPVPGAAITARSNEKGTLHVLVGVADRTGSFALPGAGSGDYRVIADAGEKGRAQLSSVNHETDVKLVLESAPRPTASASSWGPADDLGVTGDRGAALPRGEDRDNSPPPENYTKDSHNTRYGSADELVVTGPPPGRGGLPIELKPAGNGRGVRVTSVKPGSRVAEAGLGEGDVIVSVDGKKIKSPVQARKAIEGAIGSVVMLEVQSKGALFTVVVQRIRMPARDR